MDKRKGRVPTVLAVTAVLALCGCATVTETTLDDPGKTSSPTPSDGPTASPPSRPVISTSGIGTMTLGDPAADTDLLVYDDDHCVDPALPRPTPGSPEAGRWVAHDDYRTSDGRAMFTVSTPDGVVEMIDVGESGLTTREGVGVGSSVEELLEAYPDVEREVLQPEELGMVQYVHDDSDGAIGFAVEETSAAADGVITYIRLTRPGHWPDIDPATDNVAGTCI